MIHTTQVPRWSDPVQDHVAGNLSRDVAHKQDGNEGVVLRAFEAEVFIQGVQFGIDKRVAVQEIEKVHDP